MSIPGAENFEEIHASFAKMLDGECSDKDVADQLVALADRGETAVEIAAAATAMRERLIPVTAPDGTIDVCGTGGDGKHSLNISTACAFVIAACGVPVAKHGNRAASSKAGAADTLEALGVDLASASMHAEKTLAENNICFLFAQAHHPALARVAQVRKSLGRRTIFNLLGPLANPAGLTCQLIGLAAPALLDKYCEAMKLLGYERALIVSGQEGLDEISISGPTGTRAIGLYFPATVMPDSAGLASHPLSDIAGGDPAYNAQALLQLLDGGAGAYRDAVLLNCAASLIVAGKAGDLPEGAAIASEAIDAGEAKATLTNWINAI